MSEGTAAHQEMYRQLQQGDEEWIGSVAAAWKRVATTMTGLQSNLRRDMEHLGPAWRSPAADTYYAAMELFRRTVRETDATCAAAEQALLRAQQKLVEAKETMPKPGDSIVQVAMFDQTAEEEQKAYDAMFVVADGYGQAQAQLPPWMPAYGGPPPAETGHHSGGLWQEGDDPVRPGGRVPAGPDVGGPVAPAAGSPLTAPGGGGGRGDGLTGIGETGETAPAGSTSPAGVGGFSGAPLPGGPSGSLPGGGGSGIPGTPGAGTGTGGGALPGGGVLGGGARGGRGAGGSAGGRLPGAAVPGGRAGGVLGGTGGPRSGASGGRGAGGTLGSGPAGRGGAGAAGSGGTAGSASATRGGVAGRGGMMPMGGAGAGGGGDDQGQRHSWLREQDDVWGVRRDDVAPGVLGQDPTRKKDEDDEGNEDW